MPKTIIVIPPLIKYPPPKPELFQEVAFDYLLGKRQKTLLSARFYNTYGLDMSFKWELKERLRAIKKEK